METAEQITAKIAERKAKREEMTKRVAQDDGYNPDDNNDWHDEWLDEENRRLAGYWESDMPK